jgi:predicted nucleic acid-binding protein
MPIVDASVCGAFFNGRELQHVSSRIWFREARKRDEQVVAPVILLAEVAAALGRGLGDAGLADYAVGVLRSRRWIQLLPVTQALSIRAAKIAAEQKIRGCDAIYVALAQQLGMELVTLDGDQLDRGAAVVRTRTP